ncbi:hypothetical protein [Niallia hominis]
MMPRLLLAIISIIGIVKPLVVIKFIKLLKKWGTDRYSKTFVYVQIAKQV